MGRLVAYMANRTDRLGDVLDEERDAVALPEGFVADAWGIGFYQDGEVLHKKRPKLDGGPVDWETVARGVRSDALLIHFRKATVGDFSAANTHPFRLRQWLFAQNGTIQGFDAIRGRLLDGLPDFLRRSVRGSTDSEHLFVLIMSFLHDAGQLDHPDTEEKVVLGALRSSLATLDQLCAEVGAPAPDLHLSLTNGRTLYAVRRGAPLYYVNRNSLPSEGADPKGGAVRYVLVVSEPQVVPPDYVEVESGTVLVVDRNLNVSRNPL